MGAVASRIFATPQRRLMPPDASTARRTLETPSEQNLAGVSKNARKKLAREKSFLQRKRAKKEERKALNARKKIAKRAERENRLRALPESERARVLAERVQIMRETRAKERSHRNETREILMLRSKYNVCVDLGWNSAMSEKELKSLARQLAYSYNALRKSVDEGLTPLRFSVCGIDQAIEPTLTSVANGWQSWPIQLSQQSLLELHERDRVVYLTHDAETILETIDPDEVYVIGGIVDRNRLKGATIDKANELGIRTARLNLDHNLSLERGTPVLTVNHCVEILLHAVNGLSWREAYMKVLPVRKGVVLNTDKGSS